MSREDSSGILGETSFRFTEAEIERAMLAAALSGRERVLWRDTGSRAGLYLVAGRTGGSFYRIAKRGGKKHKTRIGDAKTMRVTKARAAAMRLAGGDATAAAEPVRVRTDGPTVEQAWQAYMRDAHAGTFVLARQRTGQSTLKSYEDVYRPHIRRPYGGKSLHHLARDVRSLHAKLVDRPALANRLLVVVRNLFTHAARSGHWSGPNPTIDPATGRGIRPYHQPPRERYLTEEEIARVLEAAGTECDPWPDYFVLLLLTGVRKGTLTKATWAQFDLKSKRPTWSIPITKNGQPLVLPLMPLAVDIIARRRAAATGSDGKPASKYLFPRKSNPETHIADTRDAWVRVLAKAGVDAVRIHDLRRTHGTQATLGGATLQAVGRSLGHKSIQATAVYARADITTAAVAAGIVEKVVRGALK